MKRKLIIALLFVLFILILLFTVLGKTPIIDDYIYDLIISLRNPYLDKYFIAITKLGNYNYVIGIIIILMMIFRNRYSIYISVGSIIIALINMIIKNVIKRQRPNVLRLIEQGGYSFPSGHAMISIFLYGVLTYLVYKNINNKYLKTALLIILITIIISIGISRVYLGVHFITDIIAGYILSLICVIILIDVDLKHNGGK